MKCRLARKEVAVGGAALNRRRSIPLSAFLQFVCVRESACVRACVHLRYFRLQTLDMSASP